MQASAPRRVRDERLDLFRGLAMFIIFIAHVPDNPWNAWIPARFGWSSGAELFVFCSGLASAYAFGSVFTNHGFLSGTTRIAYRIWQIYWAHIGLFLAIVAITLFATQMTGRDYLAALHLHWFFDNPREGLPALLSLRFIPNLLDILPMYMVLLAMVPVVVALSRIAPWIALLACAILWSAVQATGINLPARPDAPDAVWYFNPFAWQAIFFTGFAFGMGWLGVPRFERGALFAAAVTFLLISAPLSFWGAHEALPLLRDIHRLLMPDPQPTNLHFLRWLHLLALAYVVLVLIEPYRDRIGKGAGALIVAVGQQSLATFLASLAMAWSAGILLDLTGRGGLAVAIVNVAGLAAIYAIARFVAVMKARPSSRSAPHQPAAVPEPKPARLQPAE